MDIPEPETCTTLAPIIGLQVWIVRELLSLKRDVAQLQGKPRPSRRKSLVSLLLVTLGPWIGFLVLVSGCAYLR